MHPETLPSSRPTALDRTWTEIDLGALRRNLGRLRERFGAGARIMPTIKKDAYGHGWRAVAETMRNEPQVSGFAVATLEEGLAIREARIDLPVLVFTPLAGEALAAAIEKNLTITLVDLEGAKHADAAAAKLSARAVAHLKIDTGMGRMGHFPDVVAPIDLAAMRALPNLELAALYSHMADAWENPTGAREQWKRLAGLRALTAGAKFDCHWGGSDLMGMTAELEEGRSAGPSLPLNIWVRVGIALYGEHPAIAGLEPAMTFKSRVLFARTVPAGTPVSYGSTFVTKRETKLAVIGAGYGNGYPRALSGRSQVLIGGRRCALLGRVCMDQMVVDATGVEEAAPGAEAVLFGMQGAAPLRATEVAGWAGTISYELTCLAGLINPRRFLK